jgi:hypothetical protein
MKDEGLHRSIDRLQINLVFDHPASLPKIRLRSAFELSQAGWGWRAQIAGCALLVRPADLGATDLDVLRR